MALSGSKNYDEVTQEYCIKSVMNQVSKRVALLKWITW